MKTSTRRVKLLLQGTSLTLVQRLSAKVESKHHKIESDAGESSSDPPSSHEGARRVKGMRAVLSSRQSYSLLSMKRVRFPQKKKLFKNTFSELSTRDNIT